MGCTHDKDLYVSVLTAVYVYAHALVHLDLGPQACIASICSLSSGKQQTHRFRQESFLYTYREAPGGGVTFKPTCATELGKKQWFGLLDLVI